jgi:hypothetical protein
MCRKHSFALHLVVAQATTLVPQASKLVTRRIQNSVLATVYWGLGLFHKLLVLATISLVAAAWLGK